MAYDYVNFSCIPQLTYGTPGVYATLSDCENAVNDGITKPVLILNPLWSASKKVSPPLAISKLGDGYQQIIFQGLDQINEEWSITSPVLLGSQVDELLSQLRAFCVRSFLWSPNNGVIPYQEFTCEQWSKTRLGVNAYQIRGVFKMTVLGSGLLVSGGGDQPIPSSNIFTWASNGDANGVFYHLGLNNGVWSNPRISGAITITASSVHFNNIGVATIVDRQPGNFHTSNNQNNPWVEINLNSRSLRLTTWTYRFRFDNQFYNLPTRIVVSGSNDGVNYTVIDNKPLTPVQNGWVNFNVSTNSYFTRFRFTMLSNSSNELYFTVGELELYGELISN